MRVYAICYSVFIDYFFNAIWYHFNLQKRLCLNNYNFYSTNWLDRIMNLINYYYNLLFWCNISVIYFYSCLIARQN